MMSKCRNFLVFCVFVGVLAASGVSLAATPCTDGQAGSYACDRVNLLAFVPVEDIGGGTLNDIWGWTDPETTREYALVGRYAGTSFVDITDPENPVYLGELPTHQDAGGQAEVGLHGCHDDCDVPKPDDAGEGSSWRDIKVHGNHVYVVSEEPGHGLQVFDLTQLRDVNDPPVTFSETAHYDGFGSAHNLEINPETETAFVLGSTTFSGGPHFVDISDPANPVAAGGFGGDGYTHDAQCVVWQGADETYAGQEICFASNEDTFTIIDVTDKASPDVIARTDYPRAQYAHQGWLSEDHRWFYLNDELSDREAGARTRTLVWDLADLESPDLVDEYAAPSQAIHHNHYVRGDYLFQSNYLSGLRVLDISTPSSPVEFGFFDSQPGTDSAEFRGTWSNYPWYPSGTVAFSDIERGLFLVRPNLPQSGMTEADVELSIVSESDVSSHGYNKAVRYRLEIANQGPGNIANLVFVGSLPASGSLELPSETPGDCVTVARHIVRCRGAALASGASIVFDLDARSNNGPDSGLNIMATGERRDPDTANNRTGGMSEPGFGGFGGGCTLGSGAPMLPALLLLSGLILVRRRG